MTASNLGIIFGPTLIKPRQLDAEVSLSSLVDYPHQARMVELLISHQQMIFDAPLSPMSPTNPTAPHVSIDKEPKLSRHSRSLMDIKEVSGIEDGCDTLSLMWFILVFLCKNFFKMCFFVFFI